MSILHVYANKINHFVFSCIINYGNKIFWQKPNSISILNLLLTIEFYANCFVFRLANKTCVFITTIEDHDFNMACIIFYRTMKTNIFHCPIKKMILAIKINTYYYNWIKLSIMEGSFNLPSN